MENILCAELLSVQCSGEVGWWLTFKNANTNNNPCEEMWLCVLGDGALA